MNPNTQSKSEITNHILYVVYGEQRFFHQAAFSIFSLLKFHSINPPAIWVHTSDVTFFQNLFGDLVNAVSLNENHAGGENSYEGVVVDALASLSHVEGNLLVLEPDTLFKESIYYLFYLIGQGNVIGYRCKDESDKSTSLEYTDLKDVWDLSFLGLRMDLINTVLSSLNGQNSRKLNSIISSFLEMSTTNNATKSLLPSSQSTFHYEDFLIFENPLLQYFEKYSDKSLDFHIKNYHKLDLSYYAQSYTQYETSSRRWSGRLRKYLGRKWEPPTFYHLMDE